MYFPYLRGRQFELIAVRELAELGLLSRRILPIIEPVRLSAALLKTLETCREQDYILGLVRNPQVGSMIKELADPKNEQEGERFREALRQGAIMPVLCAEPELTEQLKWLAQEGIGQESVAVVCVAVDAIGEIDQAFGAEKPRFVFIPDESLFRRRLQRSADSVMFMDRFPKRSRNVDYLTTQDEHFSLDHLYYKEEGYVGFSDYSIAGSEYSESGFAPYAIAIHIVYLADDQSLRVRHFVSDTNDDIRDPAGKFSEALEKLVQWNAGRTAKLDTYGIRMLEELYNSRSYPGLGTVKKLCIMHHLETMSRFLEGDDAR
ncbi:hypothetical protein PA598K_05951 [Paenibacillus sp. 598K]|uniref:sce7725 family protein n=1 Tax=Paenibacillus sp. 598K TaxID=1117987 RepID=UPI000FFA9380|nr:sce7725 family protein [Paenibacillus sp. 598K]GBF77402.1 hypothetical protein PA598K_05951 [Paenibacillus sp. 598K]